MRAFDYLASKNKKWDTEVLELVAMIREYKGKQEIYLRQKPFILDRLVELSKIQSIFSLISRLKIN